MDSISFTSSLSRQAESSREHARIALELLPTASPEEIARAAGLLISSLSGLALTISVEVGRVEVLEIPQLVTRCEALAAEAERLGADLRIENERAEANLTALRAIEARQEGLGELSLWKRLLAALSL